jgi:hypothetical protein
MIPSGTPAVVAAAVASPSLPAKVIQVSGTTPVKEIAAFVKSSKISK